MRRSLLPSLLVAPLLLLEGCGVVALTHDKMLGPVSPAGNIHSAVVSDDFVVTARGVEGRSARDVHLFRPFPPGAPRRYMEPSSLRKAMRGIFAFVRGISFVVWGETGDGVPLTDEDLQEMKRGRTAGEVLERLGTPSLWIRRKSGSLMAYKAEKGTFLAFYLGMPPAADSLVPIPGLGSLTFRWNYNDVRPYKTLLFFDAQDRLLTWFKNDPKLEAEE